MERRLSLCARRELLQHKRQDYQEADRITKHVLLDEICALTGYHRSYARWLLNHPEAVQPMEKRARPHRYGAEAQHVLFLVWHAANRICTKRLIPYLPTWLEVLERHEHVQITPECRAQLLAMSASTADRLLRSQRMRGLHGLSTTKAGTLLKQQIPIRPSQHWNGTQPGFLEADLVAHAGPNEEGMYLFTLTLTDVATGWTECLPVCSKSQEVVLEAFQRARTLFPFPILGLDVDCGGEFLNEQMVAYCTREQIMLTRGRPTMKNDQCFVEAKNRHIVRQIVGHDRYCGEYAYRQMAEVYRALRLYVNCFQPSLKLITHEAEASPGHLQGLGRRRYDPAKTPLQRLLLSGVLSAAKEQELLAVVQTLDPVRLLGQVEQLQHALFRCAVNASPFAHHQPVTPIQIFVWERSINGSLPPSLFPAPAGSSTDKHELQVEHLLDWKRYRTNPFEGEWESIVSYLREHPDVTAASLFRHLQSRSLGRYHPGQLRCLQRGVRQIRTRLLAMRADLGPAELIHGDIPKPVPPSLPPTLTRGTPAQAAGGAHASDTEAMCAAPVRRRGSRHPNGTSARRSDSKQITPTASSEDAEASLLEQDTSPPQESPLDQAIQAYLQEQADAGRRPKTLLWHQTAAVRYLQNRGHLEALQEMLGLNELASVKRYQRFSEKRNKNNEAGTQPFPSTR